MVAGGCGGTGGYVGEGWAMAQEEAAPSAMATSRLMLVILHASPVRIGRKISLPDPLRTALEAVLGEPASAVVIIEHSLYARLHHRAVATTRRRRIYLRGSAQHFFDDPRLVLHEYCHVLKQWETGELTIARYCLEWLRRGYWNNRFEVAARAFAEAHLDALVAAYPSNASRR